MKSVQPPKSRSMRRQVLAVLAFGALLAALLAAGVAYRHGTFWNKAELYFIADSAAGIGTGTTVRLSGFRVGTVTGLELRPDHKVKVSLKINEEQFGQLRADATAVWVKEQLQAATLDLQPGGSAAALSKHDPHIGFTRRGTLTEIASDLRSRLAPILDDVKALTGTVRERQGDIAELVRNANAASQELAGAVKEMRALAAEARTQLGAIGSRAQATLDGARATMAGTRATAAQAQAAMQRVGPLLGQAEQALQSLNGALPPLLEKANDTLAGLREIARDGRTVSAAAATGVPSMLGSVQPLLDDTRDTLQGVRQAWPLSTLLPAPGPAALPLDSHDAMALREPALR